MKKYILLVCCLWPSFAFPVLVSAETTDFTQNEVMVGQSNTYWFGNTRDDADLSLGQSSPKNVSLKDNFLYNVERYLLSFLIIIGLGMSIYIGYELATAEGKQEQLTKALKALVYFAVGLAIIPLSYIAVKIVAGSFY